MKTLFFGEFVFQIFDRFRGGVFAAQAECQSEREREHSHETVDYCADYCLRHAQQVAVFNFQLAYRCFDNFFKDVGA